MKKHETITYQILEKSDVPSDVCPDCGVLIPRSIETKEDLDQRLEALRVYDF